MLSGRCGNLGPVRKFRTGARKLVPIRSDMPISFIPEDCESVAGLLPDFERSKLIHCVL